MRDLGGRSPLPPRYPLAEKVPRASTVSAPSASVRSVHVKTPAI